MKLFNTCLALVAIYITYATALALPDTKGIITRADNAMEPQLDPKVLSSLSTWFGWQLAGSAKSTNELSKGCGNIASIGGDQWERIGLVPANIRQPLCNASHGSPDPEHAFPNSIPAISAIIQHQLVGSFSSEEEFGYLCDHLATFQIDQFYITDTNILRAVCRKARQQVPPRPFGIEAGQPIGKAAGFAARNSASILYATILAAGAETDTELNVLCAHAPEHIDNLNAEQLNGTLVQSTLCSCTQPLDRELARSKILSWTSRLFVTVLENIGDTGDWLEWLCEHLNVEGMNSVGLVGWGSKEQVCSDAKNGLSTDIALPTAISCDGS